MCVCRRGGGGGGSLFDSSVGVLRLVLGLVDGAGLHLLLVSAVLKVCVDVILVGLLLVHLWRLVADILV